MRNRFKDAHEIWNNGASNPRAVARALVDAIDQATDTVGSRGAADPAVQMMLDHLCFLCGLPQPSMGMSVPEWMDIEKAVEAGRVINEAP